MLVSCRQTKLSALLIKDNLVTAACLRILFQNQPQIKLLGVVQRVLKSLALRRKQARSQINSMRVCVRPIAVNLVCNNLGDFRWRHTLVQPNEKS